jgi:hypothetical protein
MNENNLHQVHRRLEEKLFKLQFVVRKSFVAIKTSGAWTLIRLHFFSEHRGTLKILRIDTSKKKTSLSSHHQRQSLRSTLRKICSTFDTWKNFFPRHALSSAEKWNSISVLTTAIKFEATFHHHDLVKVVWRKIVSEKNLKTTKKKTWRLPLVNT